MSDGVAATWYDGRSSLAQRVVLRRVGIATLDVEAATWRRSESIDAVEITPRLAGVARTLRFPDGAIAQVDDSDEIDAWFGARHGVETWVDGLERRWRSAVAALVVVVAGTWLFFAYGLPALAGVAVRAIPESVDRRLGAEVESLLETFGFVATRIAPARLDAIRARHARYVAAVPAAAGYRVEFRAAEDFGANALALPGGTIMVTDDLVRQLDDEEVLAVLAHETGHQRHRHVMRSILEDSVVVLAGAFLTGDVSSASAIVVAVPTFLMRGHYSREFEREADEFAFATLEAAGISPRRFADAIAKIDADGAREAGDDANAYLSTHPSTAARIARALERAQAFETRSR